MLPAVIIGIGGTGKWVVTHLKHDIMAANQGQIPDNIALLSFDLVAQESPVTIEIAAFKSDQGKKDYFTLDFSQGSHEFCKFSGYWAKPIFSISQSRGSEYPYIHNWLKEDDAAAYSLSRGELDNTGGVGQKRQGSRTSLFLGIADVHAKLRDAINRVKGKLDGQKLRMFIVTSIAGGTGCGSFIDFCYLTHHLVRDITGVELYGFVVLPKCFESVVPGEEDRNLMAGNSFAAFRELHRFMYSTDYGISYNKNLSDVSIPHDVRLLDACYLIDGSQIGGESGSAIKPFLGLLPAVSDYIHLHLTQGAAPDYAFLLTSMGQETLRTREDPVGAGIYSTFGIYKYIFDVEGVIQTFAHKLASDVLNWFLRNSPRSESETKGEVQSFLKSSDNSAFNRNCVAYLLEHPGDMRPMKEVLFSHLKFGAGENIELPVLILTEQVPVSKLFSSIPSGEISREVTRLVNNNLGTEKDMATPSSRENSYYGVLNYYLERHDRKFRNFLKEVMGNTMRENAGEGSLNHAREFLSRLVGGYGEFIAQTSAIFERSGLSERRKRAQEEVDSWRNAMNAKASKNSQRAFVEASQRLLECQQLELTMSYTVNVAEAHQRFCQELVEQIDIWISTFESGREQIQEAYNGLIDVRRDRMAIKTREYLTSPADDWEDKLYRLILGGILPENNMERELNERLPHPRFANIAGSFSWQFAGPGAGEDELACYLPAEFSPWAELRRNPVLWNYHFVNNFLTQGQFGQIRNLSIMDILAWQGKDPASFSNTLLRNAAPLAVFDTTAQQAVSMDGTSPPATQDWNHTLASWTNIQPGGSFSTQLRNAVSSAQTSHNQYEIVQYQSKHLIKMQGFTNLQGTEGTYRERIAALGRGAGTPPLHIFPADKNAASYESKMPSVLGESARCLNLRIVRILADEDIAKDFAFAYAYDLISRELVGERYSYVYGVTIRGREERVILGGEPVDVLENLCLPDELFRAARNHIGRRVSEIKNERAKKPGEFAQELRQRFNDIEVEPIASAEDDLKRVIKIILWQQVEIFEKEANR